MSKKPVLQGIKHTYYQEADSCDPAIHDRQELIIEVQDGGGGPYVILKTERWAMDTPDELTPLITKTLQLYEEENGGA